MARKVGRPRKKAAEPAPQPAVEQEAMAPDSDESIGECEPAEAAAAPQAPAPEPMRPHEPGPGPELVRPPGRPTAPQATTVPPGVAYTAATLEQAPKTWQGPPDIPKRSKSEHGGLGAIGAMVPDNWECSLDPQSFVSDVKRLKLVADPGQERDPRNPAMFPGEPALMVEFDQHPRREKMGRFVTPTVKARADSHFMRFIRQGKTAEEATELAMTRGTGEVRAMKWRIYNDMRFKIGVVRDEQDEKVQQIAVLSAQLDALKQAVVEDGAPGVVERLPNMPGGFAYKPEARPDSNIIPGMKPETR